MTAPFPDHFSSVSSTYSAYRPGYPAALFDWIATLGARDGLVWDCAAGSGQATIELARRFERVVATDASAAQVAHAPAHPHVTWWVAQADASGLDAQSVDLVTVAQALHWFELDSFWGEVRRVVKPEGVIVAWTYAHHHTGNVAIDRVMHDFARGTLEPYWPPNRAHVDDHYTTLSFPFSRIEAPQFEMHVSWSLDQLLGYVRSWSATAAFAAAEGADPVVALEKALRPRWGDARRAVRWPLTVLAGRT
jgi:SAM-dependent methyltransferase